MWNLRTKKNKKLSKLLRSLIGCAVVYCLLILLWQFVFTVGTRTFGIWKPYVFPNINEMLSCGKSMILDGTIQVAIFMSVSRALIGYFLSIIIGSVLGIILVWSKIAQKYFKPLINGIQTLPSVCWVPFAIIWFGLGNDAIIFVVVMGAAFSVTSSIEGSIKGVDKLYIDAAKTMGASNYILITKVILPAALPNIIIGLRHGWSFAWRALMSGEVISSVAGLGYTLMIGRDLGDINQVMLVMVIIIIIGALVDKLCFSLIETKILKKRGLS